MLFTYLFFFYSGNYKLKVYTMLLFGGFGWRGENCCQQILVVVKIPVNSCICQVPKLFRASVTGTNIHPNIKHNHSSTQPYSNVLGFSVYITCYYIWLCLAVHTSFEWVQPFRWKHAYKVSGTQWLYKKISTEWKPQRQQCNPSKMTCNS